jgi:ElaB/YqjD/DUF883 family membrane-anchored ribosome-binding protein
MASVKDHTINMSEEMQHIIEHAHAPVEASSGELDNRIKEAGTALKEHLDSSKTGSGKIEEQFQGKVKADDEFVHIQPYYAIGGTFLAGLLMGWFMSRK